MGWPLLLALASLFLAMAAALLAFPVLSVYVLGDPGPAILLPWAAAAFTALLAWPVLVAGVFAFERSREDAPVARRRSALLSTILGLLGFALGLASLPLAFPVVAGGWWVAPEWVFFLVSGWFVYVPTVFAPVVLSHAAFAVLAGSRCRHEGASRSLRAAAILLTVVALVSLLVQGAGALSGPAWGLASLTAPGYAWAATGAWRESRARAIGARPPGLEAPSPGASP